MKPPCTRMYTHPFFEATPPGAAPGPPVKTGARVRHFRGCKKAAQCQKRVESPSQVQIHSPGNMEQASSRGHEASPQSGLGVGCKRCSSSIKLRGLSVRAQARRISISLSFSVAFFSFFSRSCLPRAARRGAARGSAIQKAHLREVGDGFGGLCEDRAAGAGARAAAVRKVHPRGLATRSAMRA